MKKLFLFFVIAFVTTQVSAQSLYGDMETWRTYTVVSTSIQNPNHWFSYDSLTFCIGPTAYPGAVFVRQTFQTTDAHSGNYAAKIISRQQDTLAVAPGILVNAQPEVDIAKLLANPGDPYAAVYLVGGTAVTQRIYSVTAWIKYFPKGGDNGEILVEAHRKFGTKDSVIGRGDITVTSTPIYTSTKINITYLSDTLVPQTIIINFLSSAIGNIGVDSSTMYVDDMTMSAVNVENITAGKEFVACYPNPCNGVVNLNSPVNEKFHWQLYNIGGRQVAEKEIAGHVVTDLSYLPNGVYFYTISDENGIIVQRGKLSMMK